MATLDVFVGAARFPAREEQIALDQYEVSPGGAGLNTSVALSFLNVPVVLSSRVGDDVGGRLVRDLLEARGIRPGYVTTDTTANTAFSLVNVGYDGEIGLLHHAGANACLELTDISAAELGNCSTVHLAGAMSLKKLDDGPTARLMAEARALGKETSLCTSRLAIRSGVLAAVLPHLDLIFANLREALAVTGCEDHESAAAWFLRQGVRKAVITLGGRGAYVASPVYSGLASPLQVHAVDTTGCGDAFVAGFLYAARRGFSTADCLAWGNALGAHCARSTGALVSPFECEELAAMLNTNDRYGGLAALVLAGGRSQRMAAAEQKLVLQVGGKPMIQWIVEALRRAGVHRIVVLVGHAAAAVKSVLRRQPVEFLGAADWTSGTGGSVRAAVNELADLPETIVVVNGDTPLLQAKTVSWLVERHFTWGASATVVTATSGDPRRYAHASILRDENGDFRGVLHFQAAGAHGTSGEVNTGTYCFQRDALASACQRISVAPDGREHLSDALVALHGLGKSVRLEHHPDFSQFISINTRENLAEVDERLREHQKSET